MTEIRIGRAEPGHDELSADGIRVIEVLASLVDPLWRALPTTSEVVLHEVGRLPNSVVAIAGHVTGRQVGDPATDVLLEQLRHVDTEQNRIDYQSLLPDGRRLRSSTMIVRDADGEPVAALCINTDITEWLHSRHSIDAMVEGRGRAIVRDPRPLRVERPLLDDSSLHGALSTSSTSAETFPHSVEELVSQLIDGAIASIGVPVDLMKKNHKLTVVKSLEARGLFLLKDAVELIAAALGVTRFTIYNYLNELGVGRQQ